LALQHPEWTRPELAAALGCSLSFVKKWLTRFREADPDDLQVLFSRSRARHTPAPPPDLRLIERIIEIRTAPPENAARAPRGLAPSSSICIFVDAGTSILLWAQPHEDFHAETASSCRGQRASRTYGLPPPPPMLTFDRDPRWVGSSSGRDFPSALRRFLLCLGIEPHICPPQRPDKNAFVERYHSPLPSGVSPGAPAYHAARGARGDQAIHAPFQFGKATSGSLVQGSTAARGLCDLAAPCLPCLIRSIPIGFLQNIHGHAFPRRIGSDGCVEVDEEPYYIKQALAGHHVVLLVNAPDSLFAVYHQDTLIKQVP
jgi:hypothetical protein